jgi:hypothetical protein
MTLFEIGSGKTTQPEPISTCFGALQTKGSYAVGFHKIAKAEQNFAGGLTVRLLLDLQGTVARTITPIQDWKP